MTRLLIELAVFAAGLGALRLLEAPVLAYFAWAVLGPGLAAWARQGFPLPSPGSSGREVAGTAAFILTFGAGASFGAPGFIAAALVCFGLFVIWVRNAPPGD